MSYIIEHNRYLFKEGKYIVLIQKERLEQDTTVRFEYRIFTSLHEYWDFIAILVIESQNLSRQRATGWNKQIPFDSIEYVKIYESKLRNAMGFNDLIERFHIYNEQHKQLQTTQQLLASIQNEENWKINIANYFNTKGAI